MAEILGLGITHYPGMLARRAAPISLKKTLRDPGLPAALRDPAGWPAAMRQEWGNDQGEAFAAQHREELRLATSRARAALDEFRPDVVVIWGDDHYENFQDDVIPAFCVLAYDRLEFRPWSREGAPPNLWGEPADKVFSFPGHRPAAKHLASGLIESNFDVAYAYRPAHKPLGHAFVNSLLYLDWDRRGFPYPVIPFIVNCYGRKVVATRGYMETLSDPLKVHDLDPPSPSPARCMAMGAAAVKALQESPWRVALIGSSSWSHAFLTRKNSFLYPDVDADRRLFEQLRKGDYDSWRSTTLAQVEDSGQHEMLNWFCLAGAMEALGRTPSYSTFIESSVMNSNKVVAIF